MPVTQWKYIGTQNEYHIGPMAQDFKELFHIGDGESLSAMDKSGVALLGVQALDELVIQQQKQIDELMKIVKDF